MKKTIIISLAVLSLLILGGCSGGIVEDQPEIPRICPANWMPVCGVDGTTYANECGAGDIGVAYVGECKEPHICTAEEKENKICTREYMPVCGSDGVTHSTGCTACSAGVDSYTEGEC